MQFLHREDAVAVMARSLRHGLPGTYNVAGDGVLPFLIEWPGETPARTAAAGCELMSLDLAHPDPAIGSRLAEYAVPVDVTRGDRALSATILTPTGVITL